MHVNMQMMMILTTSNCMIMNTDLPTVLYSNWPHMYEGAWPEHHCKVADGALLNETIPKEEDGSYAKCKMYVGDDRNKTTACDDWQYFGYISHTIVSEVIRGHLLVACNCWDLSMNVVTIRRPTKVVATERLL